MDRTCKKCNLDCVPGDSIVVCEGFCVDMDRFHAKCVGLSVDQGKACSQRNVFWMCDECTDLMGNLKFRAVINRMRSHAQSHENEIARLKANAEEMREKINFLFNNDGSKNAACVIVPAHKNECDFSPSTSLAPLSSTRICNNRTSDGQRNEATLKLHISNIANDVTEKEILQMVTNAIGVEQVRFIKCLVPPWRDSSSLDYISFKIEIDDRHREAALNTSNWPRGVRCREFVNYGNTTWRPIRG